MEKIKSVLSGHSHKKEEEVHDPSISSTTGATGTTGTTSTASHGDSQAHPIYDQMTGQKADTTTTSQPLTSGTTTSAGQTGVTSGLGQTEQVGSGTNSTVTDATRPGASSLPKDHASDAFSSASIKSGVIGFGNERQEHAALPHKSHVEDDLTGKQVLGGGSLGSGSNTADSSTQPGVSSQPTSQQIQNTHDQATTGNLGSKVAPGATAAALDSTTQQPHSSNLRQESYTADTDRSFPLAGGVASKHGAEQSTSTAPLGSTSGTSSTKPSSSVAPASPNNQSSTVAPTSSVPTTSTAGPTTTGLTSSTTQQPITSERAAGVPEEKAGVHNNHGREALAAAAGAAAVAAPLAHSHEKEVDSRSTDARPPFGDQTSTVPSTTANTASSTQHHPDAVAAARAAAFGTSATQSHGVGSHDNTLGNTSTTSTGLPSTQSGNFGTVGGTRPETQRSASRPHIPGEFPTPTPDESKTFLYYRHDLVPEPGAETRLTSGHHAAHDQTVAPTSTGTSDTTAGTHSGRDAALATGTGLAAGSALAGHHSGADTTSTASTSGPHQSDLLNKVDPRVDSDRDGSKTLGTTSSSGPTGQHELRHTGTLDEPQSRSAEHADSHLGRDAAIAGGLGAGAAGLGYAAAQKHDSHATGTSTSSPYSSTALDPRVLGHPSKLDEQRFDPQAKTAEPTTHHALQTSNPAGVTPATAAVGGPAAVASTRDHSTETAAPQSATATDGSPTLTGPVHNSSLLNKLDPRVKEVKDENVKSTPVGSSDSHTAAQKTDPEHHYGRDAALVGAGAATGAGLHHELHRNDTPGTGTTVLPQDGSTTSAPASSSIPVRSAEPSTSTTTTAPSGPLGSAAPLSASTPLKSAEPVPSTASTTSPSAALGSSAVPSSQASTQPSALAPTSATSTHQTPADAAGVPTYKGPLTTSGTPFYGTTGAPAPVEGATSTSTSHTSPTTTGTAPSTQDKESQHHYGRDAALAGGAAAGAGGLAYAAHHDKSADTGPASSTIGPHSSNVANVLDPRVQPDPSKQAHHTAGSTAQDPASRTIGPHDSNIANIIDPRVKPDPSKQSAHSTTGTQQPETAQRDHHYGRDAALAGGAGAAGYGAYEAAKAYGDHRSTQPGASMNEQRYDPTASGAHAPSPVPAAGHYDYNNKTTSDHVNQPALGHRDATDHTGRNVALGGAALGAGALGGAAYAESKHGDPTHQASTTGQPLSSSSQTGPLAQSQPSHGVLGHQTTDPTSSSYPKPGTIAPTNTQTAVPTATHSRFDSVQQPGDKDHTKRDAALAGTAGAAAAGSAYEYSHHHGADHDRARLDKEEQDRLKKEQHAHDKEQHKLDKEHHKQEKEAHKLEKEQHKHDKELAAGAALTAKEEKKHHKEEEKLEKERRKSAERLEKEREKEREKEAHPEKKHGILGFLHRDKSKKEKHGSADSSPRQSGEVRRSLDSNPRHSKEYAAGGAALGAGAAATAVHEHDNPDSPRWKGKHLLHKEPPKGHPAREAQHDIELQSGKRDHVGVDGPIGRPDAISGYEQTGSGVYGAQPISDIPAANKVVEPHTGLPMNVGKFGEGTGGTDANPAIAGHHHAHGLDHGAGTTAGTTGTTTGATGTGHPTTTTGGVGSGTGAVGGESQATNWEDIKKKDTIF